MDDYRKKKKNKQPPEEAPKALEPPPELICSLCKKLMKDAVIIPCCGESYCYDCIQDYLCENEFTCPACKEEGVSPDNLAPNKALRKVSGRGGAQVCVPRTTNKQEDNIAALSVQRSGLPLLIIVP